MSDVLDPVCPGCARYICVCPPPPPCRFNDGPAVARYAMDKGCVCFPEDREQDLCAHHEYKSTPLGSMELIRVY